MGTLTLEGETLGQKHQHYNKLLKEVMLTNTPQEIKKINYNESDIDNLFKIDIACIKKDVNYILEVFKCEDMLYVSRALKQSVWLITDIKYADIVNPDYLHDKLLPQMSSKAGHKLLLSVRLNLKDEQRVELFHRYYEGKNNLKIALKWLPNCSISYIENVIEKRASDIPIGLMKRLCEKSIKTLEVYARKIDDYSIKKVLSDTTFLLKYNAEKYVSIVNSQERYTIPRFSPKATKIIMKTKPDIILDNFEKFATKIDVPTFIKFLKREDIKDFLMKHFENKRLKLWFTFDTMKHFIFRIPSEGRFDFIKRICIDKTITTEQDTSCEDDCIDYTELLGYAAQCIPQSSNASVYRWYKFAPFSVAFTDLKKLIRVESNPSERIEIFAVLITCAKQNTHNIYAVLQYYRERHMNEPFKFKSHFVNILLSQSMSHRFDDKCWSILNDFFSSMEVYNESENNVQTCLKHIIIYKVVHDAKVPDIVEKKFEFDTLNSFQRKLNSEEKEKIFQYLYTFIITKIQNFMVNTDSDLKSIVELIINALKLVNDWKRNLLHYNIILDKIREIIKINRDKSWNTDFSGIYQVKKSWRKHMFNESLFLYPKQETCINALKHGPEILMLSKDNICTNDSVMFTQLLNKLRIYWPQTLARAFEDTFRNQLNDKTKHKSTIRALCILLPKEPLIDILNKYTPHDTKINWAEADNFALSIQKCFANYMHLARPHPPVDIILLYAKGDYLQFVLPSVHSILFDLSSDRCIKYIPILLDSPVSLQKHGLKIAFTKLKIEELLATFLNTWKSTKNPSIRATCFKLIFELLCKEENDNNIKEIWNVLDKFIDNLTSDENKVIYSTLGQAKNVPISIRQAYCIKSYRYLKSLPPKTNCDKFIESLIHSTCDIMESINVEFVNEIIFEPLNKNFTKQYYSYSNIISAYLLSTKCETIQTQRYDQIFVPLLKEYFAYLQDIEDKHFFIKYNFNDILKQIHTDFVHITIKKNMITPIKLYSDIYNDLSKTFSTEDNYVLITTCRLAVSYVQVIDRYRIEIMDIGAEDQSDKKDNSNRNNIYSEVALHFAEACVKILNEEIAKYFPSIHILFSRALNDVFDRFNIKTKMQLTILKVIQERANTTEGHLLVLSLLPDYVEDSEDKEVRSKICEVLNSHPSAEIKMHYQQLLRDKERYEY